jgi:hypothetical protein
VHAQLTPIARRRRELLGDVYQQIRAKHQPGQARPHRLLLLEDPLLRFLDKFGRTPPPAPTLSSMALR